VPLETPLVSLLRPRSGRRLPAELQPEAVFQAGLQLVGGTTNPEFSRLLSSIDGDATVHGGNEVELFHVGAAAMDAMVQAIAEARREVLVESYIFRDDDTGKRFQRELQRSAERGATVRVLADAFGSWRTHGHFWRELAASGVAVRLYNRALTTLWWQPFRDHRKILVVDRTTAFTGGMNIADEYGSSTRPRHTLWRDTHMRVVGPAAVEMAAVFAEGWERAGGEPLHLDDAVAREAGDVEIMVQDAIRGRGHHEMVAVLAALLGAVRERVWMTTAYFVPGRRGAEVIASVARRGIDVRLLVPGHTDVSLARHAGHAHFRPLLDAGVRVYEYQPAILHAKTLVADGRVSIVGSANMDLRSYRFNAECNLVLFDESVGSALEDQFRADIEASREILPAEWNRRPLRHRILDGGANLLGPLL
jgi:cardiolipin synthase